MTSLPPWEKIKNWCWRKVERILNAIAKWRLNREKLRAARTKSDIARDLAMRADKRRNFLRSLIAAGFFLAVNPAEALTYVDAQMVHIPVDSYAAIATFTPPPNTNFITTSGYYSAGDGGGAVYAVQNSDPGSLYPSQTKTQFANGKWAVLTLSPVINAKQVGVQANGSDDASNVQALIQFVANFGLRGVLCQNITLNTAVSVTTTLDSFELTNGQFICNYAGAGAAITIQTSNIFHTVYMESIDWIANAHLVSQPLSVSFPGNSTFTASLAASPSSVLSVTTTPTPFPILLGPTPDSLTDLLGAGITPPPPSVAYNHITGQLTGSTGGIGTYSTDWASGNVSSETMNAYYMGYRGSTFTGISLNARNLDQSPGAQGNATCFSDGFYFNNAWFGRLVGCTIFGLPAVSFCPHGFWCDGVSIGFTSIDCIVHDCGIGFYATSQTGQHYIGCAITGGNSGFVSDPTVGTFPSTTGNSPYSTFSFCQTNTTVLGFETNGTTACHFLNNLIISGGAANFVGIWIDNKSDDCTVTNCQATLGDQKTNTFVYINNSNNCNVQNCFAHGFVTLVTLNGTSSNCYAANVLTDNAGGCQVGTISAVSTVTGTTTITLTLPTPAAWNVGTSKSIVVWGAITNGTNPLELNGTYTTTASAANSVSFSLTPSGTWKSGGQVYLAGATGGQGGAGGGGEGGQMVDNTGNSNTLIHWRMRGTFSFTTNAASASNSIASSSVLPINLAVPTIPAEFNMQQSYNGRYVFVPPWMKGTVAVEITGVFDANSQGDRLVKITQMPLSGQNTNTGAIDVAIASEPAASTLVSALTAKASRVTVTGGDAFLFNAEHTSNTNRTVQTSSTFHLTPLS